MIARLKVFIGGVMLAPVFIIAILYGADAQAHPTLTPTQLSNLWLPYMLFAIAPFVAGLLLIRAGLDENADE